MQEQVTLNQSVLQEPLPTTKTTSTDATLAWYGMHVTGKVKNPAVHGVPGHRVHSREREGNVCLAVRSVPQCCRAALS